MIDLFDLLVNSPVTTDIADGWPGIDERIADGDIVTEDLFGTTILDVEPSLSDETGDIQEHMVASTDIGTGAELHPQTSFLIQSDQTNLLVPGDFTINSSFDTKNNCIVHGNVADDIQYVDQQIHSSCSLMAQEQFIERYIGRDLPESYLEWQAEQWGVYSPDAGTSFYGQDALLKHFDIPHTRTLFADQTNLEIALDNGCDVLVGVDARYFYNDPTFPEGSGHAVAVVGKGVDTDTGGTCGYYLTDSNYPGTVRFVSTEAFDRCWWNDMISIPSKSKV